MQSLCPVICEFLIVILSSVILAVQSLKECNRKQWAAHFILYIHLKWISVCAASMCTFSCKYNVILIWTNSCLSPSLTLSAKHSHFIPLSSYEDRDVEKKDIANMVYAKSMVALAELLPRMGWWRKGSLFCSYFCHPLWITPNHRDAQNIFFWKCFILYKLINKKTTKQ